MNFNDLPHEIKLKIFHINKEEERKEKEMKNKFNIVMQDLENVIGELPFYFDLIDRSEDEEYISHFILSYLEDLSYMIC